MGMTLGFRDFVFLGLCGSLTHYLYRKHHKRLLPLPPSPPGWPFVGNAFQLPLTYVHLFYQELGRKLGSKVVYVEAFGIPIIVINDIAVARELLEKRSAIYSSRPPVPMVQDVVGTRQFFVNLPYGDEWRNHRRMFQQYFAAKNLPRLQEKMLYFVRHALLPNILGDPEKYRDHIQSCVGGLSLSMTYGLPVQRNNDPLIHLSDEAFKAIVACGTPGTYLVNILPILKYIPAWIPGAHFKHVGRRVREQLDKVLEEPYKMSRKNIENGADHGCFVSDTLKRYQDDPNFEEQEIYIMRTASQVFGAASETTVTAIVTFILVMLKHPEVQGKVQCEIDGVVGLDRLPEISDITPSKLPYFSAVLKEVLRWNPILPIGVPHLTSIDDVYNGYYIPKGTTIMANTYAMLQDETIFPNPRVFNPERFFKDDILVQTSLDPTEATTFGFGRRECPGSDIALAMFRITAASIISLFQIVPALDANNKPIDFTPEFAPASIVSDPLPFPCSFTPRQGRGVECLLEEYMNTDVL